MTKDIKKINNQNLGNAGEYYLSSYLSTKDCVVTVTLGRNEGYDLIVDIPKKKVIKLSVKTTTKQYFLLAKKDEIDRGKNFFYGFVKFNNFNFPPDFWIVPSNVVAKCVRESYNKWMKSLGRNGKEHNPNSMREFHILKNKYYPKNWEKTVQKYFKNTKILGIED